MIIRHYVNPITVILKTQLHKLNLKVLQRDYGHNQIISIKQIVVNNHTNCIYCRHHTDEQTEYRTTNWCYYNTTSGTVHSRMPTECHTEEHNVFRYILSYKLQLLC